VSSLLDEAMAVFSNLPDGWQWSYALIFSLVLPELNAERLHLNIQAIATCFQASRCNLL